MSSSILERYNKMRIKMFLEYNDRRQLVSLGGWVELPVLRGRKGGNGDGNICL